MAGGKRASNYWKKRQSKQFGRFSGKAVGAFAQPSVGSVAKAAWSGVKYLRTLVNSEVHKFDGVVTTAIAAAGTITHLSDLSNGDGANQRTGNSVLLSYIACKHYITINSAATNSFVRVIIFTDNQQIADTAPAVTDVLNTASPTSFLNTSSVGRFSIISDKMVKLSTNGPQSSFYKYYTKKSQHIRYNGTTGADVQRGGLYMLTVGNEATNTPGQEFRWRIGFHDN